MGFAWSIYLALLLPLPLVSVVLLTTCGHWSFVRNACRAASGLKIKIGSRFHLSLRACCTILATIVFILCSKSSWDAHFHVHNQAAHDMTPDRKIQMLAKKWRNERNFWISALVVLLWYVLGGLMKLQEENAELRVKLTPQSTAQEISKVDEKKKKEPKMKTSDSKKSSSTKGRTKKEALEIEMTEMSDSKKDK